MANAAKVFRITTKPGIQRDGTILDAQAYTEGEWVRFYRGKPKKMGGMARIETGVDLYGTVRALRVVDTEFGAVIHVITKNGIWGISYDDTSPGSGTLYDLTPDPMPYWDDNWMFDIMYDALGTGGAVIFATPSGGSVGNQPVFYKDLSSLTSVYQPLVVSDVTATTGGITANTNTLTVAAADNLNINDVVKVAGAGSPLFAAISEISSGTDFKIDTPLRVSVAGATMTINGASVTVTGTAGTMDLTTADTSTFEVGDDVEIRTAGGVDMVSRITNIVGTTVTLYTKANITVAGAAVSTVASADGGIAVLGQYLTLYGSYGRIANSNVNAPSQLNTGDADEVNAIGSKFLKGLPMRAGSGGSSSGLYWSTDSVVRMTWIGGQQLFRNDIISSESSLLCPNSVVEYDGRYFWVGVDKFLMFNGSVQELPNLYNKDYFFDNLNYQYRHRVWGFKNSKYGEIWWFYPSGLSTECSHAIIFNVRENCWYDVVLARSAGYHTQVSRYPIMSTVSNLWTHEVGTDVVDGSNSASIRSSFTTDCIGFPTGGMVGDQPAGDDRWTRFLRVEPDFDQVGDMSMTILTREYATSSDIEAFTGVFSSTTERIDMRVQGRHARLKFTSNIEGGDFSGGSTLTTLEPGDIRQ